jgi:hypothetical protein
MTKRLLATVGPARFLCGDLAIPAHLVGTEADEYLEWETSEDIPAGRWTVALFGPVGRFHIEVETEGGTGQVFSSYPTEMTTVRLRREPRTLAPEGATIHLGGMSGRIIDVSSRGLAFAIERAMVDLAPGYRFDASISIGDSELPFRIDVRNVSTYGDVPGALRVGAEIEPATSEARTLWYEHIDALRHPWTRTGRAMGPEIWDLFSAAGYLGLSNKHPADFEPSQEAFDGVCRMMAGRPDIGVQVVLPSPRGLEAAITALAEFPNTAVLYHMARRPGSDPRGVSPKTVLRESYEHAIGWIARSGLEYLSVWVQDVTRFAVGTHRDFALTHANGVDGCVHTFRALEIDAKPRATLPPGWDVRLATPGELPAILERFRDHFPAPLPSARAWDKSLVEPTPSARPCAERERALVVASRGGRVQAAAILENLAAGMHLFGIFDTCHSVRCAPGPDGVPALLAFASDWYARRGKDHFVYALDEAGDAVPGAKDLGLTHDTIVKTSFLGEFLEHVWHMTA